MRGSKEIVWELGAVLKSKGNLPVKHVGFYGYKNIYDNKFSFDSKDESKDLPGALLEMSLSKVIRGVDIIAWVGGQFCELGVWMDDSEDGTTNIDDKVVEAFGLLKWKW